MSVSPQGRRPGDQYGPSSLHPPEEVRLPGGRAALASALILIVASLAVLFVAGTWVYSQAPPVRQFCGSGGCPPVPSIPGSETEPILSPFQFALLLTLLPAPVAAIVDPRALPVRLLAAAATGLVAAVTLVWVVSPPASVDSSWGPYGGPSASLLAAVATVAVVVGSVLFAAPLLAAKPARQKWWTLPDRGRRHRLT